jgi:aminoglycoside 6'-N-acetyltransferase
VAFNFRPLQRDDFPLLTDWFSRPHIEPWWREPWDADSIEEHYGPSVERTDPTEVFIVEQDNEPIGLIQRYRIDDNPEWKHALSVAPIPSDKSTGIDYVIGAEDLTGHGLGPKLIDAFVNDTWTQQPDISAIVVSCQQENRRSWRALEKSDFHRVWAGNIQSDDPSDEGPSYVYVRHR